MIVALRRVPLIVMLAAVFAMSMYIPMLHALNRDAHLEARSFFYAGTLFLALLAGVAVAVAQNRSDKVTRSRLLALLAAFTLFPAMGALPMGWIVTDTRFINLYVEMVSAATTTGGSLFAPERLSETLHLWRALVAWQGGMIVWIAAIAILAPLNLGGFEVAEGNTFTRGEMRATRGSDRGVDSRGRVWRAAVTLVPIYVALTLVLWAMLATFGESSTTALIHAMSVISTSGISDGTKISGSAAGLPGEIAVAAFLLFAVSRQTFSTDMNRDHIRHLGRDRELRIAGMMVGVVTVVLFTRHWIGAYEVGRLDDTQAALGALWGSAFTALSFLTTAGFESFHWQQAQAWSGLGAPAVMLLGLAIFGGGVATTAGGVKLLRIYTLYAQGRHQMHLLVHPHSVVGATGAVRRIPTGGIEAAWVFFMLFATSIAGVTLLLTLTGLEFEAALALAVACLTTTGPLAEIVLGGQGMLNSQPDLTKIVAAMTMVLGRVEALALFALLNPDFWRD